MHDLTEIKDAQLELEQQKHALDQHSIVSVTDTSGNIQYKHVLNASGYGRDELLGNTHRILNSGFFTEYPLERYVRISRKWNVWHQEIRNKNKRVVYWLTTIVFLRHQGNTKIHQEARI